MAGIIRAAINAGQGILADSYLDAYKPYKMGRTTAVTPGVARDIGMGRNGNDKGSNNIISNGSVAQVAAGQLMCLVDGGRVVDYCAEPGPFKISHSSSPSFFNGTNEILPTLKNSFDRVRFGGNDYREQRIVYINLRPMEGIKFGTRQPIPFFDETYGIDVAVRANGQFSLQIVDPWKFFNQVIPPECITDGVGLDAEDFLNETFMSEFLTALGEAFTDISAEGIRISRISGSNTINKVKDYVNNALNATWFETRGLQIVNVGFNSLTYDEDTKKLLQERNKTAIYTDPKMQQAFVNTSIARGIENAGSNANGAAMGFMGVGMGMNAGGNMMGQFNASMNQQMQQQQMQNPMMQQPMQPQQPMQQAPQQAQPTGNTSGFASEQPQANIPVQPAADTWKCSCGHEGNIGKFCAECGSPKPAPAPTNDGKWTCSCGQENTGKFCPNCGSKRPDPKPKKIVCDKCGYEPDMSQPLPKFCPNCGDPINEADYQ